MQVIVREKVVISMPYTIYNSKGDTHTVPDGVIDNTYYSPNTSGAGGVGLQLVGRNAINYGQPIAQDFLQLLQNFARPDPPPDATSVLGQLWFNTTDLNMYVRFKDAPTGGIANWRALNAGAAITGTDNQLINVQNVRIGSLAISVPVGEGTNYDDGTGTSLGIVDVLQRTLGHTRLTSGNGMVVPLSKLTDNGTSIIGYIYNS